MVKNKEIRLGINYIRKKGEVKLVLKELLLLLLKMDLEKVKEGKSNKHLLSVKSWQNLLLCS